VTWPPTPTWTRPATATAVPPCCGPPASPPRPGCRCANRPIDDEWLLVEVAAPVAADGLVAATGRVWERSGTLLASGEQTMLCRPAG
jgi:hypothetical protein